MVILMKEVNKRKSITIKLSENEWNQLQAYMSKHLEVTPKSLMMEALNDRICKSYKTYKNDIAFINWDSGGY